MHAVVPPKYWLKETLTASFAAAKLRTIFYAAISSPDHSLYFSRFAPLQLAAQNLEIRFSRRLNQFQALRCALHSYLIGRLHGNPGLPVECQEHRFRIAR